MEATILEKIVSNAKESETQARKFIQNKYSLTNEQLEKAFIFAGSYSINKENEDKPSDKNGYLDGAIPFFVKRKNKSNKYFWDCFGFAFWMCPEINI